MTVELDPICISKPICGRVPFLILRNASPFGREAICRPKGHVLGVGNLVFGFRLGAPAAHRDEVLLCVGRRL